MFRKLRNALLNRKRLAVTLAAVFLLLSVFAVVSLVTVQAYTGLSGPGNDLVEPVTGHVSGCSNLWAGKYEASTYPVQLEGGTVVYKGSASESLKDLGIISVKYIMIKAGSGSSSNDGTDGNPIKNPHKSPYWIYKIESDGKATQVYPEQSDFPSFIPIYQGYNVSVGYDVNGYPKINATANPNPPANVNILGISHSVLFFNSQPAGSIKVWKKLTDNTTDSYEFTIQVKGKYNGYNETKKVTAGSFVIFTKLPYGKYTVIETGLDSSGFELAGYYYNSKLETTPSIDVIVGSDDTPKGASIECVTPANVELWVKNQRTGKVTFKKDFKDDGYNNTTDVFKIKMTGPNNYSKVFEVTGGKDAVETDLKQGTYTVQELTGTDMPDGFRFWKLYVNGSEAASPYSFKIENCKLEYTVKAVNDTWSKIKLIKKNAWDLTKGLADAEFKVYNGSKTYNVKTDANGEFLIADELAVGSAWNIQETKAPDDYVLDSTVKAITLKPGVNAVTFKDEPINHCWIKIKKIDAVTKAPIDGATFEISNNKDFINSGDKKTFTLKVNGETQTEDLVPGHWWVREKEAPPFYLKDNTVKDFDVAWHEVKAVEFANTPVGGLSIRKTLESGTDTATEFKFNVTGTGKNENFTLKAGGDPYPLSNLAYGTYTITEINAAQSGYKLIYFDVDGTQKAGTVVGNDVKIDVTVDENHKVVNVNAVNRKQGKIILQKQVNGGLTDPNYKFKLRLTDKATGKFTDYDVIAGKDVEINNVEYGSTYTVQEITDSLPQGIEYTELYINGQKAASIPAEFTVSAQNKEIAVKAVNRTWSKIKLIKKNAWDLTKGLPDAEFKVYNSTKTYENVKTDANGEFLIADELSVGSTWKIQETKAPADFVLDTTEKTVTLKEGVNEVMFTDVPVNHCWIKIKKIDAVTKAPVDGATFEISNNKDFLNNGDNKTFTLTVNGETQSEDLVPGHWWVRETEAPSSYLKDTAVKDFDVAWHEIKAVEFANTPVGGLTVTKLLESGTDNTTEFNFNVTGMGKNENFSLKAGGSYPLSNLPYGTYTVTEFNAAASDYKLLYFDVNGTQEPGTIAGNDVKIDVAVDQNHRAVAVKAVNRKQGKIILQKEVIGKQTDPAKTFTFRVTDVEKNTYTDYQVTPGTAKEIGNLEHTKYRVQEITDDLPTGYAFNNLYMNNSVTTNPVEFTLGKDNLQVTVKAENRTWGKIKLIKKNAALTEVLPDAEFKVYNNTKTYDKVKTDANGEFLIADELAVGSTWNIQETKAPSGYELDTTVKPVTLIEGVNEVTFTDRPLDRGWLKIKKTDSLTNLPINGAVFELAADAAFTQNYLTMDVNGETTSPDLKPGHWFVREKTAPAGYLKDTRTQEVDVAWNKTTDVAFANTPVGTLRIAKELDGGYKDTKTTFEFVLSKDGKEIDRFSLAGGGFKDLTDLAYGGYKITETTPAEDTGYKLLGYRVNSGDIQKVNEITVQVNSDKKNVTVAAVNRKLANLTLSKVFLNGWKNTTDSFEFTVTKEGETPVKYNVTSGTDKVINGLDYGKYEIRETGWPEGYAFSNLYLNNSLTSNPVIVTLGADNLNVAVKAENDKKIPLTVRKVDAWHPENSLPRMEFTVADNENFEEKPGGIYFTGVTNDKGEFVSQYFLYGTTLWVKETKAPEGYEIDTVPKMIKLTYENNVVLFADPPINNAWIKIVKLDSATKQRINGAIFQVANNEAFDNSWLIQVTANGEVTTKDLLPGDYWVKEYEAPKGYIKDNSVQKVTLAWRETKEVTFTNAPAGNMLVIKTDAATGDKLTGAKFDIFSDSLLTNKYANIEITSTSGTELTDVPIGTYWFVETQAPAGYELNATPVQAAVEQGKTTNVELKNTKTDYVLWKKDSATMANLTGAEFDIYNSSNLLIGHYATDSDGKIPLKGFAAGTYKAVETKAPAGYKLLTTPVTFTIVAGQTGNVIILNDSELEYGTGGLKIRKVDATTNKPLKGAVFDIYSDASLANNVFKSLTTDVNGELLAEGMDPGNYWVVETKAPTGYKKNSASIKVTVVQNQTTTIVVQNTGEQDYQTGTDDYNMLLAGAILLIGGLMMVFFSRRKVRA